MKRKTIIHYIVLPVLLLLAGAAFYIYKEYNRTHKDTVQLKADYAVSATDFLKEFENNEDLSNKKYWDKVVSVNGMIKDIQTDIKGFYTIVLGDTATMSSVRCNMDSAHNDMMKAVIKGSHIAVKGICTGYNADELLGSDIILVRSVIDHKMKSNNN